MKRLLRNRRGSSSLLFFGLLFLLLVLCILIVEMGGVMENYDYAMSVLQRSANSAVEASMAEEYRADHILRLNVEEAKTAFRAFAAEDMPDRYDLRIQTVSGTASPPSLRAVGTLTFPTLFSQFGFRDVTVRFTVEAANFAVDGR